jgi:hypothetical protein
MSRLNDAEREKTRQDGTGGNANAEPAALMALPGETLVACSSQCGDVQCPMAKVEQEKAVNERWI